MESILESKSETAVEFYYNSQLYLKHLKQSVTARLALPIALISFYTAIVLVLFVLSFTQKIDEGVLILLSIVVVLCWGRIVSVSITSALENTQRCKDFFGENTVVKMRFSLESDLMTLENLTTGEMHRVNVNQIKRVVERKNIYVVVYKYRNTDFLPKVDGMVRLLDKYVS